MAGLAGTLVIVRPETVITWHRKGFRLFWTWKSRRRRGGRAPVPREVRDIIRRMSRENPLWGAPRIHGELLKLGIEVSEATVSKYIERHRKPPSQTWRTFLRNHVGCLASYVRKLVTELSGGVFGYLDSVLERHSFDEFGELI